MRVILLAAAMIFALGTVKAHADAAAGEALFDSAKCKQCHNPSDKKKVGPGLTGIMKRTDEAWTRAWLKNAVAVWEANQGYTVELKKSMNKADKPKPAHKTRELTDQEISDLVDYLKTL
ncbi:MAG: cytochrome c [Nitrospinae bacterium]|nr:cytochrome c [Nitrospinota bacterium]